MKIHIVTVDSGWILQRLAQELAVYGGYTISQAPRDDVDVNYYFDLQNCFKGRAGSGKQVAFFTHFHEDSADHTKKHYLALFKQLDGVVCMCKRYLNRLEDIFMMHGVKARLTQIMPGDPTRHFQVKKPKIGIFQRGGVGTAQTPNTGHPGKGHDFMLEMVRDHTSTMQAFEWRFTGQGWRRVVQAMEAQAIDVYWFEEPGPSNLHIYESHLHDVDYVLVPSLWEGGPMIIPQALAAGVKVISADVGWASEFPYVDLFPVGETGTLAMALKNYLPDARSRKRVETITWDNYKIKLEEFCATL